MKNCGECLVQKDLTEFYRNRVNVDGYEHVCKQCSKNRARRYAENRSVEKTIENKNKADEYYRKNRERILASKKEYYKDNVSKILPKVSKYYKDNVDKINERTRLYNINNKE